MRLGPIPNDFGFGEEHELLRQSARRMLEERCPISEVRRLCEDGRGWDPAVWKQISQLGWVGLVLPEELGGAGLGHLHLALLLEEMGRRLLPSPYLGAVLAGMALARGGDAEQRGRWCPAVAAGDTLATLALLEPDGSWEPEDIDARAEAAGDGFVLHGEKTFVMAGASAGLVVAPFRITSTTGRDGELALFAVEAPTAKLAVEPEIGVDATRRTARLRFEGVRVGRGARLEGDGPSALRATLVGAWAALAAEMVGAAESTLRLARDYAIERKQFGRQIGSFQAVKHPIVDTMVGVEMARTHAYAAAAALDHAPEQAEGRARMAKALASDVFSAAARRCVQVHGGYGFTWDCDAHLYFKRALWSRAMLGDALHHRRHLAQMLFGAEAEG